MNPRITQSQLSLSVTVHVIMVWAQSGIWLLAAEGPPDMSNSCGLPFSLCTPPLLHFDHSGWQVTMFLDPLLCSYFFSLAGVLSVPLLNFLPLPIHLHRKVPTKCHFLRRYFLTTHTFPIPTTFTHTCSDTYNLYLLEVLMQCSMLLNATTNPEVYRVLILCQSPW